VQDHSEAVERAFTQQAPAFEDPEFNQLFTVDSDWLFERLELDPDDLVLDVAAGTGHVARRFAPHVRAVVAVDATAAMLERGWIEAKRAALRNVVFMQADATALPFVDGSFDVVVSRFALHHFEDPAVPIAEMRRVLRPGGRLAVSDVVADSDMDAATRADMAAYTGCIAGALTEDEFRAALGDAGLVDIEIRPTHRVHEAAGSAIIRARKP
jgi:arsenite methyltransferase